MAAIQSQLRAARHLAPSHQRLPEAFSETVVEAPHNETSHMRHLLLAAMLCAACASSPPSEYQRGSYRPVRAPTFTPAEDAPHTVGQPGHLRQPQEYPRSPHKRLLPPTQEPGLWAGDGPRAARPTIDPNAPRFFNVPLPLPDAPDAYDKKVATHCGAAMSLAAKWASTAEWYGRLDNKRQQCIAAALYSFCAEHLAAPADKASAARLDAVKAAAARFKSTRCPPEPITDPDVNGVRAPTQKIWLETDQYVRMPL